MVYGMWYMVYGMWYMEWYIVYGIWYMAYHGMAHGLIWSGLMWCSAVGNYIIATPMVMWYGL